MPKNPIASAALALGIVISGLVSALLLRGAVADVLATGRVFSDFQVMLLAAKLAAGGDAAAAYDASRMLVLEQGLSPGLNRVIHYSYPPTLALVLQPFLSLGPGVAQLAWTAVGGGILALAIAGPPPERAGGDLGANGSAGWRCWRDSPSRATWREGRTGRCSQAYWDSA